MELHLGHPDGWFTMALLAQEQTEPDPAAWLALTFTEVPLGPEMSCFRHFSSVRLLTLLGPW